ncbi:MAG: DNA repair protein RadC [Pseudomonadota bacterium]
MVTDGRTPSQCSRWADEAATDCQLLTDLLSHMRPSSPRNVTFDVERLAYDLLERQGGIRGLLTISPEQFRGLDDRMVAASAVIHSAVQMVLRAQSASFHQGMTLTSPGVAAEFLVSRLGHQGRELFGCILMDSQHRVIAYEELFFGTIDGAQVHIREIVRFALRRNAAALMMVHNHPSGARTPSTADIRLTLRVKEALALVDVRVVDHLLVAGDSVVSLAQLGHV